MTDFSPAPCHKRAKGWTAERQRAFITNLAITGSVQDSAFAVGLSPRSAYHLRGKPGAEAFSSACDAALEQAGGRLLGIAFDRAIHGAQRRLWQDGEPQIHECNPSDRVLMFLLDRIGPAAFRRLNGQGPQATIADVHAELDRFEDELPEIPSLGWKDLENHTEIPKREKPAIPALMRAKSCDVSSCDAAC